MKTNSLTLRTINPNTVAGRFWTACAARLLALLLLLALPVVGQAQFTFTTNNDGSLNIASYTGSGGAVTIPSMINGLPVTSIGSWAFWNCTSLTSVTIPASVISIEGDAFSGCTSLSAITVDENNFYYCSVGGVLFNKSQTALIQYPPSKDGSSYTIPNSVTSIGDFAFYFCTSLTSVTIPNSVTSIGDDVFIDCTSLTAIIVDTNNLAYSSVGGVLFNKSQTALIQYPPSKDGSSYTIPNSVTSIGDEAFYRCYTLASVTIPNSVTSIGDYAFYFCSMTNVTLSTNLTSIGDFAFNACYGLTNVTIPNSVTSIGDQAFHGCDSLISVTIPSSVTSIGYQAFGFCDGLASVTIGNNASIGGEAFLYCTSLTNVTIGNSASIGYDAFSDCESLASVTIGNNASIGREAFSDCFSLASVTIGNSASIGWCAFSDWYSFHLIFYYLGNAPSVVNGSFSVFGATTYYLPGTTGWDDFRYVTSLQTIPWYFPNPTILNFEPSFGVQTNRFGFTISWATNISVVVEACTNFANPVWQPVQTNTLTGGSCYFSDPTWTNYPARFYRLRSP